MKIKYQSSCLFTEHRIHTIDFVTKVILSLEICNTHHTFITLQAPYIGNPLRKQTAHNAIFLILVLSAFIIILLYSREQANSPEHASVGGGFLLKRERIGAGG